jgi:hypothetical protein
MRKLYLNLTSADGKFEVAESTYCPSDFQPTEPYLRVIVDDLNKRLDELERMNRVPETP